MLTESNQPDGVLVVDDDPFTRGMLATALTSLGWAPVRSAASAAEAMWLTSSCEPRVAVVDLDLGEGPTGIDLALGLRRRYPDIGLVIISTYAEPRLMGVNLPALPENSIYLVKKTVTDTDVLGRALQLAVERPEPGIGETFTAADPGPAREAMSDLNVEIMRLIAAGHSNAEIARVRVMSVSGVEKAVARIIRQLEIPGGKDSSQRVLIAQAYFRMIGAVSARRG